MEDKDTCKWCGWCTISDLEKGYGICNIDINERVELDNGCCSEYYYNDNLDRC